VRPAIRSAANITLLGIDGLVGVPAGSSATQNGIEPQRVVQLAFAPDLTAIRDFRARGRAANFTT